MQTIDWLVGILLYLLAFLHPFRFIYIQTCVKIMRDMTPFPFGFFHGTTLCSPVHFRHVKNQSYTKQPSAMPSRHLKVHMARIPDAKTGIACSCTWLSRPIAGRWWMDHSQTTAIHLDRFSGRTQFSATNSMDIKARNNMANHERKAVILLKPWSREDISLCLGAKTQWCVTISSRRKKDKETEGGRIDGERENGRGGVR